MESACQLYSARNTAVDTALIRYKNVIAGYTHLYWASSAFSIYGNNLICIK
jgi:cobyrinic acid a,c-diamide synthase